MYTIPDARREALFSMAYREYLQELIRHARSMIDSRELSEDLVQDVFVKMWLYLVRGGKIEKTRAFLHHVLNNVIVDTYRKHKTSSLDALLEQGHEPSSDDYDRLYDIIDGKNAFQLIDQLPKTYQKVLRMKYGKGLSYQEISQSTGQSKNTTAVQVHRGLEKLKLLCEPRAS
jgi:RNA polymerase sigma factor (sigma-70 family)